MDLEDQKAPIYVWRPGSARTRWGASALPRPPSHNQGGPTSNSRKGGKGMEGIREGRKVRGGKGEEGEREIKDVAP